MPLGTKQLLRPPRLRISLPRFQRRLLTLRIIPRQLQHIRHLLHLRMFRHQLQLTRRLLLLRMFPQLLQLTRRLLHLHMFPQLLQLPRQRPTRVQSLVRLAAYCVPTA